MIRSWHILKIINISNENVEFISSQFTDITAVTQSISSSQASQTTGSLLLNNTFLDANTPDSGALILSYDPTQIRFNSFVMRVGIY